LVYVAVNIYFIDKSYIFTFLYIVSKATSNMNEYLVYVSSYPRNRPWKPIGLRHVKDSTLSRTSAQRCQ
jgi:hypothetical protein